MAGFFKVSNDIFQALSHDPLATRLYITLCANIRYSPEPTTIKGIEIQQGQWLRSIRKLQGDLAVETDTPNKKRRPGVRSILRAMAVLSKTIDRQFIATEYGTLFTLPTIEEHTEKQLSKKKIATGIATSTQQVRNKTERKREEGEKKDLQKDPSVNPEVRTAQKTSGNTHTPGEVPLLGSEVDPTRTPKVRKNCTHFKCSDHEVELLKAWYIKKGLPIEMLPEVSVVIDDWLDGSTPAAKKARKSETHYRQARADWAIKKVKNILNMANGNNGHKTSNMDRLKAALAKAKAEEEQQKQQQKTGGFVQ